MTTSTSCRSLAEVPTVLLRRLATVCPKSDLRLPDPHPNLDYILDPKNRDSIAQNIASRKGIGDIGKVHSLKADLDKDPGSPSLLRDMVSAALDIPNRTHPDVTGYGEVPKVVKKIDWSSKFDLQRPRPFEEIAKVIAGLRNDNLNYVCGDKSYFLLYQLAELEHALVHYTVDELLGGVGGGFELISVPDLLHPSIVERCGMPLRDDKTQVYRLDPADYGDVALSGTSEMALAGYFAGKVVKRGGVRKMVAVSRCFRAESSRRMVEKGIYRVHNFTKVEMFAVTPGDEASSESMLQHFLEIQDRLFGNLGLGYRVLDMPAHELGAPAYRKFDVEATFPGRTEKGMEFGEISSCSNCTDFQSRRLDIRDEDGRFCHTVNGTACAVPRMIMAICEQFQMPNGIVALPDRLKKYMRDAYLLEPKDKSARVTFKFIKSPKYFTAGKNF